MAAKKRKRGAQKGNKNAAYTPAERERLRKKYLAYLRDGNHGTYFPDCCFETVQTLFVSESEKQELAAAERENLAWWYDKYKKASIGELKDANMTGLIFAMKNKCGWRDSKQVEVTFPKNIPVEFI